MSAHCGETSSLMPMELWVALLPAYIAPYLDAADIMRLRCVNHLLRKTSAMPVVWRNQLQTQFRFTDAQCTALERVAASLGTLASVNSSRRKTSITMSRKMEPNRCGRHLVTLLTCVGQSLPSTSTVIPIRSQKSSPPRPVSREATSSYGVTPTPTPFRGRHLDASLHAPSSSALPGTLSRTFLGPTWSSSTTPTDDQFNWLEVDQRGTRNSSAVSTPHQQDYLYHTETGLEDHHQRQWAFRFDQTSPNPFASTGITLEHLERSHLAETPDASALYVGQEQHRLFAELLNSLHDEVGEPFETRFHRSIGDDVSTQWRSGSLASAADATAAYTGGDMRSMSSFSRTSAHRRRGNQSPSQLTCTSALMHVVCAETARKTAVHEPAIRQSHFPFEKLFRALYSSKISSFCSLLATRRFESTRATVHNATQVALEMLSLNISNVIEGGCGASNEVREALVVDLLMRGRIYRSIGSDAEAMGDFAVAHLLEPSCTEAYSECCLIATSGTGPSQSSTLILSPSFSLDEAYDAIVCDTTKTLFDRAAFLFEVSFWRGPSLMLYLYNYLICDTIRVWPVRLLLAAEALAQHPYEQLTVRAWILYDCGKHQLACEAAELAASLLPADVSRYVSETERDCVDIVNAVVSQPSEPVCEGDVTAFTASVEKVRDMIRSFSDLQSASVLIPSFPELMSAWNSGRWPKQRNSPSRVRQLPNKAPPSTSAAFTMFTLAFMSKGSHELAVDCYRRAIFCRPLPSRLGTTLNNLAFLLLKRDGSNATGMIVTLFERAVHCAPTHTTAMRNLARCQRDLGLLRDAHATLTRCISVGQRTVECSGEALCDRSRLLLHPEDDLAAATKRDPRLSHPYRLRAAIMMDRGEPQSAIEEIDRIIMLTMDASDVALRALFRRDSGDLDSAVRDMALACCLAPDRTDFYERLIEFVGTSAVATTEDADATRPFDDIDDDDFILAPPPEMRQGDESEDASLRRFAVTPTEQLFTNEHNDVTLRSLDEMLTPQQPTRYPTHTEEFLANLYRTTPSRIVRGSPEYELRESTTNESDATALSSLTWTQQAHVAMMEVVHFWS